MQDFCFLLKEGEQLLYSAKSTGHLHARKVIYILLALFFVAVGLFYIQKRRQRLLPVSGLYVWGTVHNTLNL